MGTTRTVVFAVSSVVVACTTLKILTEVFESAAKKIFSKEKAEEILAAEKGDEAPKVESVVDVADLVKHCEYLVNGKKATFLRRVAEDGCLAPVDGECSMLVFRMGNQVFEFKYDEVEITEV